MPEPNERRIEYKKIADIEAKFDAVFDPDIGTFFVHLKAINDKMESFETYCEKHDTKHESINSHIQKVKVYWAGIGAFVFLVGNILYDLGKDLFAGPNP